MNSWWVKFEGRESACVEAASKQEAMQIAADLSGHSVKECDRIPYPAEPRLNKWEDPKYGAIPAFCFQPDKCVGRTACPSRYACTE